MDEPHTNMIKTSLKALAALVVLGLSAQAAPTLTSLLVIVVLLVYARHAWTTLAQIPPRQLGELLLVAGLALFAGFLAKLDVGPLIITGLFLLVTLPLWRRARTDPREAQNTSDGEEVLEP